jgi:excisionase family DNA binding protein
MSPTTTTERFAPIRQAAEANGIAYRTLLLWIARGEIQAYRFGPKLLQVNLDELAALRKPVRLNARGDRAEARRSS